MCTTKCAKHEQQNKWHCSPSSLPYNAIQFLLLFDSFFFLFASFVSILADLPFQMDLTVEKMWFLLRFSFHLKNTFNLLLMVEMILFLSLYMWRNCDWWNIIYSCVWVCGLNCIYYHYVFGKTLQRFFDGFFSVHKCDALAKNLLFSVVIVWRFICYPFFVFIYSSFSGAMKSNVKK